MGELFLATRRGVGGFERPVALKRVLPSASLDEKAIDKLLAEARMAAKLVHPNIVAVQDVGRLRTENGGGFGWFIAMEWLPGVDLVQVRDVASTNGMLLPPEFVARVGQQVAKGLAHAHTAGIVHRDVSPHNVMVTFDGAVKIVDFGVALKSSEGPIDEGGYLFGKIAYCSPEQVRRNTDIGPRSDLFSLGVVMYELLAGIRPFRGGSMMEVADAVVKGRYLPIDQVRPGLPEALVRIVHKALQAKAEDRFASGEEMEAALAEWLRTVPSMDPGAFVRDLCPEQWKVQKESSNELFELTFGARPLATSEMAATRRV
jgi:serine/threonine-protein kinase